MVDIIELLYRQYKHLREEAEASWNQQYELQLTSSEWYVMNNIYQGFSTVPEMMKRMDITKQGVHKFIIILEGKGLVQTELVKLPKVQKKAKLTQLGYEVIEKSLCIQTKIEQQIQQNIGNENYRQLKRILDSPWIEQSEKKKKVAQPV